mmetsp:Transcript_25819/g.47485  ORF Transcript_25819/g.47485 Transcript_25819/m.47485 type:complete len:92 (+) Transcript_25819:535-810(+)
MAGSSVNGFFGGAIKDGGSGGEDIAVAIISVVAAAAAVDGGAEAVGSEDSDNEAVMSGLIKLEVGLGSASLAGAHSPSSSSTTPPLDMANN